MLAATRALDILVQLLPEVILQLRAKIRRMEEDRMCELALSSEVVASQCRVGRRNERQRESEKKERKTQASARDQAGATARV